jgi:hypothetical protein
MADSPRFNFLTSYILNITNLSGSSKSRTSAGGRRMFFSPKPPPARYLWRGFPPRVILHRISIRVLSINKIFYTIQTHLIHFLYLV